MTETICRQCHAPRSQCDPRIRHVHTFRASDELWDAVTRKAEAGRLSRNEGIEEALTGWTALPGDQTPALPEGGGKTRTVRCADELWDRTEAKAVRMGGKPTRGAPAALHWWTVPQEETLVRVKAGADAVAEFDRMRAQMNPPVVAAEQPLASEVASLTETVKRLQDELLRTRAEMKQMAAAGAGVSPAARTEPSAPARERVTELRRQAAERGMDLRPASQLATAAVPAGTAVFREPGAEPVVTVPAPQPLDHSGKRGRTGNKCPHRLPKNAWCKTCETTK
jgi:hypothetical protein